MQRPSSQHMIERSDLSCPSQIKHFLNSQVLPNAKLVALMPIGAHWRKIQEGTLSQSRPGVTQPNLKDGSSVYVRLGYQKDAIHQTATKNTIIQGRIDATESVMKER